MEVSWIHSQGEASLTQGVFSMVNDPSSDAIHWTPDGLGFNVTNSVRFAQDQLPLVFKHNNVRCFCG